MTKYEMIQAMYNRGHSRAYWQPVLLAAFIQAINEAS